MLYFTLCSPGNTAFYALQSRENSLLHFVVQGIIIAFYTLQSRENCILHFVVQAILHFTLCNPGNIAFYSLQYRKYCILHFTVYRILHLHFVVQRVLHITLCSPRNIAFYTLWSGNIAFYTLPPRLGCLRSRVGYLRSGNIAFYTLRSREYCILHFAVQEILHFTPCGPGSDEVRFLPFRRTGELSSQSVGHHLM